MAVQARHRNLFPPQIISNREFLMNSGVDANGNGSGNLFGAPVGYGVLAPLSGTTTATEIPVTVYGSATTGSFPAKGAALKSDSGLTCSPILRKRTREGINPLISSFHSDAQNQTPVNRSGSFTFLGEDISFQIHQQQMEIDRFITQHTHKVRMEIEDRRKRYSRRIAAVLEESVMNKLRAKQEEIENLGKLNCALEEKVKSLCVENQIWRDLAQTNEATANALRCNLEQVIAQIEDDHHQRRRTNDADEEAQSSCCGSNFDDPGSDGGCIAATTTRNNTTTTINRCKLCEKEESCVLLLPCRHLCLCNLCGSAIHTCPVCHSTKTASVHVNLS